MASLKTVRDFLLLYAPLSITRQVMKPVDNALRSYRIGQLPMRIDFWDIYAGRCVAPSHLIVESLVREFFFSIPQPFGWLLALREFIAGKIGLKTAHGRQATLKEAAAFTGRIGERIALFEVWDRSPREIVTGQRDKHLDFALSFVLEIEKEQPLIKLITTVQVNTSAGKAYLFVVKPVHKVLMPLVMKRLCQRLATLH